ncbi:hypothetical protein D3C85_1075360 [compost metagenome]
MNIMAIMNKDPIRCFIRKESEGEYSLGFYDASLNKQYRLFEDSQEKLEKEVERVAKKLKRPFLIEKY